MTRSALRGRSFASFLGRRRAWSAGSAGTPPRSIGRTTYAGILGPTIINSGIIIGGMGGQFWPTPEMALDHDIVFPEYLDADTPDEIVEAVRQNILFGAQVIKVCVDCKPTATPSTRWSCSLPRQPRRV